jgi:hypothetical protein
MSEQTGQVDLPYVAGFDRYIEECERVVAAGHEGFASSRSGS